MSGLNFAFLNPWALAGLAALPALWFILRFLPPLPKNVFLPTTILLKTLTAKDSSPETAPWWLILLRFLILIFLILAFANPVSNPQKPMNGTGPVKLIFDNSWASSQIWDLQLAKAEEIIEAARKSNRPVEIIPTASASSAGLVEASDALSILKSLEPQPWPSQFSVIKADANPASEIAFISTGLEEKGFQDFAEIMSRQGKLTVFVPDIRFRPGLIRGADTETPQSVSRVEILPGARRSLTLQATDEKSKSLGQLNVSLNGQKNGEAIIDDGKLFNEKQISQWKIAEFAGSGGVYLTPRIGGTGIIGFVGALQETQKQNFSDALFYLSRAVAPFAKLETGGISDLIEKNAGVIILNDYVDFNEKDLSALKYWISRGGILLRFSGPKMSETKNILVPVPLKEGMRSLSGELNMGKALKLAAFPKSSPFMAMLPPNITVERQLLAEPSAELQDHVWAQLTDGTPFITARAHGRGLIVLVHSTATPDWSDFVLSGFYVTFLKEVSDMSALADKSVGISQTLQPILTLDGWGNLVQPGDQVKPIERNAITSRDISPDYPPGLYGNEGRRYARNLGDTLPPLKMIDDLPANAEIASLNDLSDERKFKPVLLSLAFFLFLADWLIHIINARGAWRALSLLILFMMPMSAHASPAADINRASAIHLACVTSSKNEICRTGLEKLSFILKERSSAEMGSTVIIDPEKDDLSFYPLLYWPVEAEKTLSPAAKSNLRNYLSMGGMIVIDTQEGNIEAGSLIVSPAMETVRETLRGVNLSSLKPAGPNHVLFKSFYLLNQRPEYDLTGSLWVEENSIPPQEELSSVILTGGDWMRVWGYASDPLNAEMSYRFGVNLVLYALTGNYKADQVHMKTILERLGE